MEYVAAQTPDTPVIVITGYASTASAVEALRKGAYDYIAKPFDIEMIKIAAARALEKARLQHAVKQHVQELEQRVAERTSAREETNTKLNRSLAELKATQTQLIQTEKLSALGELIAGFAHELNNPLASVLGYAELLGKSEVDAPGVPAMLQKLHQEAGRCHQIVKNLLGFARKQKPAKQEIDVNALCRQVLELLTYQFRVNNITVVRRLKHDLPGITADTHQLQQVLVNILTNAYQAMFEYRRGGRLTVTTRHDDTSVFIKIADTGPGIAAEDCSRIFDPFYTTKEHGTGLGLSLSYSIIEEHGGEIAVVSKPNAKTAFTIQLPFTPPPTSRKQPGRASPRPRPARQPGRKR